MPLILNYQKLYKPTKDFWGKDKEKKKINKQLFMTFREKKNYRERNSQDILRPGLVHESCHITEKDNNRIRRARATLRNRVKFTMDSGILEYFTYVIHKKDISGRSTL